MLPGLKTLPSADSDVLKGTCDAFRWNVGENILTYSLYICGYFFFDQWATSDQWVCSPLISDSH